MPAEFCHESVKISYITKKDMDKVKDMPVGGAEVIKPQEFFLYCERSLGHPASMNHLTYFHGKEMVF